MGSDCFSSWKHKLRTIIERGDPLWAQVKFVSPHHTIHKRKQSHGMIDDLDNVDFFSLKTSILLTRKLCCMCFDDNEAVIKMILEGKKPNNETCIQNPQSLLLIGLFDRINLDPRIQIKFIGTKNQLADILTKGNFTRDEWKSSFVFCLSLSV